jgi:hypothetical protein
MTATDMAGPAIAQLTGLGLITHRTLVASPVDAFFGLHPGDRALVKAGEAVGRGQPSSSTTVTPDHRRDGLGLEGRSGHAW